jgi:branched-chain amino acid transport system permease protein
VLIGVTKAFCIGLGFSKFTLVAEFVIMGIVLVLRPYGLLGKPPAVQRAAGDLPPPLTPPRWQMSVLWIVMFLALPLVADRYITVMAIDIVCYALFAVSLHFIMGPAGMVSFGHAAYFGLGAYAAALLFKKAGLPMEMALVLAPFCAGLFAVVYGWFCVRLSGVYLAMLTLAFAQISWSIIFQWDEFTSGSNGIVGVWPSAWLSSKSVYYYLTFVLCGAGIAFLWRVLFSPFGYVLRAGRDSPLRAEAIGIDVRSFQWVAFILAGTLAGLAGAVFAFSKGSISPSVVSIGLSTDALVMVLLGGLETLTGPVVGAAIFTWLRDALARETDFWRAVMGLSILAIVLLFPQGLVGGLKALYARWRSA